MIRTVDLNATYLQFYIIEMETKNELLCFLSEPDSGVEGSSEYVSEKVRGVKRRLVTEFEDVDTPTLVKALNIVDDINILMATDKILEKLLEKLIVYVKT